MFYLQCLPKNADGLTAVDEKLSDKYANVHAIPLKLLAYQHIHANFTRKK